MIAQKEDRMIMITGNKVRKILLLASVLVLMLALCGCRTRITNNDEVSNVMYDEEGVLQDEYNMRRDELGLGKAPKPVFTGLGAPDDDYEDYEYGSDSQALEDYDPDASGEEPYDDSEEVSSSGSKSDGSGADGGNGKVTRRSSSGSTSKTDEVEVVLDAETNGGSIGGKGTITVKLKKDGKYEDLPAPDEREGFTFSGWFTKRDGGKNVAGKNVASDQKHKLYAQWAKQEARSYTITLNANDPEEGAGATVSGSDTMIAKGEGDKYTLPSATCIGFDHKGWTDEDNNEYKAGDVVTVSRDQTFTAKWEKNPQKYWENKLSQAVGRIDQPCVVYSSKYESFLKDCGLEPGTADKYEYAVYFGSKEDAAKADNPLGKQILVIPEEAADNPVVYGIIVFNELYEPKIDEDKAFEELSIKESDRKPVDWVNPGEANDGA